MSKDLAALRALLIGSGADQDVLDAVEELHAASVEWGAAPYASDREPYGPVSPRLLQAAMAYAIAWSESGRKIGTRVQLPGEASYWGEGIAVRDESRFQYWARRWLGR